MVKTIEVKIDNNLDQAEVGWTYGLIPALNGPVRITAVDRAKGIITLEAVKTSDNDQSMDILQEAKHLFFGP